MVYLLLPSVKSWFLPLMVTLISLTLVNGVLQRDTLAPFLFHNLLSLCSMNVNRSNERNLSYIGTISIHNLPRLPTTNINISNEKKWFHIKKGKKVDDIPQKLLRVKVRLMMLRFVQIHLLKPNVRCLACNR